MRAEAIKEAILAGCTVKHSYKYDEGDWVQESSITIVAVGLQPVVYIFPQGDQMSLDKIDEAVEKWRKFIFVKDNLWYKMLDAQLQYAKEHGHFDMDDEEDRTKIYEIREKLIEKEQNS